MTYFGASTVFARVPVYWPQDGSATRNCKPQDPFHPSCALNGRYKQYHQALLKAKYSPRVAAASCTQKNTKKPMWPCPWNSLVVFVRLSRYTFLQNFVKLGAAVHELPCARRKTSDENNTAHRGQQQIRQMCKFSIYLFSLLSWWPVQHTTVTASTAVKAAELPMKKIYHGSLLHVSSSYLLHQPSTVKPN